MCISWSTCVNVTRSFSCDKLALYLEKCALVFSVALLPEITQYLSHDLEITAFKKTKKTIASTPILGSSLAYQSGKQELNLLVPFAVGARGGLLGGTNHPGLCPGGGTGGELQ